MDILDILLLLVVAAFAVSGYRQGFVVGVVSFAGFLGGLALGFVIVPTFLDRSSASLLASVIALCAVLALAVVGQVLGSMLGAKLREAITWQPAQMVDAVSGAVVSVIAVLMVAWFLGLALFTSSVPTISDQVRSSSILKGMTQVLPQGANQWFSSFSNVLNRNGFPQVFAPFQAEDPANVPPPDPALLNSPVIAADRASIVKIRGQAPSCGKDIEGSGFVYASGKVMTNAHVVGGTRSLVVRQSNGKQYAATVVLFDPKRDIAVLDVPSLKAPQLNFDLGGKANDSSLVVGYPEDGPFTVDAARIREQITATGADIYSNGNVRRQVFALYAQVQQGNSGGPLLSTDGRVLGVVFAKSLEDKNTGYALTAQEVSSDAQAGAATDVPVNTQACAI
ncbi:Colicin V production protein [Catenulispora acidiphila DSM 44928]|uniref:Colicin V production protein n=1 Tax=Catenulispora acidiphila (strain DSM 44928 / JCM 14897 / NBRC 102108 / NRRL B-24433 / ID139908) TaxID=479433 RepID=C7Q3R5_CATAD|nr:MarP family serine protease [Catenulispora acidiphila]ACU77673.1 Colicin V production protein [Catenulispora acidiphila DSM 44928]